MNKAAFFFLIDLKTWFRDDMPVKKAYTDSMVRIRKAVPADAARIAKVQVDSWRTTYRDLLSREVLDHQSYENRTQNWFAVMTARVDQGFVLVAEKEGNPGDPPVIIGFASGGFERSENKLYDGELYTIYMLEEVQRQGIGKKLIKAVAQQLLQDGYTGMLVWVLRENPARKFYEAMGGQFLYEQPVSLGSIDVVEVAYGWKNLKMLTDLED